MKNTDNNKKIEKVYLQGLKDADLSVQEGKNKNLIKSLEVCMEMVSYENRFNRFLLKAVYMILFILIGSGIGSIITSIINQ